MALHLLWRSLAAVVVVTSQFTRSVSTETFLLPDYDENNLAVERVSRDDDVTVDSSGSGDGMSPNSDESESRNTANILRFSLYSLGGGTFLLFLLILTLALCLCWARRYSKSQNYSPHRHQSYSSNRGMFAELGQTSPADFHDYTDASLAQPRISEDTPLMENIKEERWEMNEELITISTFAAEPEVTKPEVTKPTDSSGTRNNDAIGVGTGDSQTDSSNKEDIQQTGSVTVVLADVDSLSEDALESMTITQL